jgi:carbon-monoxide dehydrogenase medium subunit
VQLDYLDPMTIEEAISLLVKHDASAKIIAGGTDIFPQLKRKEIRPALLIDITAIPELDRIDYDQNRGLRIGALTSIRRIEKSKVIQQTFPVLTRAASLLGSMAIRNVATIGGNLCNAAPSADMAGPLLALRATTKVVGPEGARNIPLDQFFVGPGRAALGSGDILVEIHVPTVKPNTKATYCKYRRSAVDLAVVGVTVMLTVNEANVCEDIKIVLGAAAPTPMRAFEAEKVIRGQTVEQDLIQECGRVASREANPRPTSMRASPEYKREIIERFVTQALREIVAV